MRLHTIWPLRCGLCALPGVRRGGATRVGSVKHNAIAGRRFESWAPFEADLDRWTRGLPIGVRIAPDRNERESILITGWGSAFGGPVVATSILHRLLNCSIVIPSAVTATGFVKALFRPIAKARNDARHQLNCKPMRG